MFRLTFITRRLAWIHSTTRSSHEWRLRTTIRQSLQDKQWSLTTKSQQWK